MKSVRWQPIAERVFPVLGSWENDTKPQMPTDVSNLNFAGEAELALSMAKDTFEAETRRKQTTETKASIFLAFLAASLPVIGTLAAEPNSVLTWASAIVLLVGLIYMVAAAFNAFSSLKAASYSSLGAREIETAVKESDPSRALAQAYFSAVSHNYVANNEKITRVSLAQAHILRAFIMLVLVVMLNLSDKIVFSVGELRTSALATINVDDCKACIVIWEYDADGTSVRIERRPGQIPSDEVSD